MNMEHVVLANSYRPASSGARRIADLDPQARVEVTVTIRGPALPSPDEMPAVPLSPAEFAARYGAERDAEKVADVLRGFGLAIDGISQAGRSLRVSGPASAFEAAFKAKLGIYQQGKRGDYRGREGELQVPKALDGLITGIHGLDQRRVAHRKVAAAAPVPAPLTAQSPSDLEKLYNFPPGSAKDQVIAIAEFGEPLSDGSYLPPVYMPEDVDAFCKRWSRPLPRIQVVPVNIAPLTVVEVKKLPPDLQSAAMDEAGEVMLDVELVAALSPEATLLVLFASFDQKGWVDLLDAAVSSGHGVPVTLSISWGLAEDSPDWSSAALAAINERLQIAAMHGVTVCVASGDDGTGDGVSDSAGHVDFPASSPFVLGVGGTQLDATSAGIQEVTWWEAPGRRTRKGGGATGGGVSTKFARPAWQSVTVASINPGAIDGRVVPDVGALAGAPFYDLVFAGHLTRSGGTSAAAPVWASLLARINAALPAGKGPRFLTPLLYARLAGDQTAMAARACRAIASGNNASYPSPGKGYAAGPGYNAVTGWGVPSGQALLEQLLRYAG
jgi:kumamolisin